jgi:thioredoxin-like negative regulator of GroEL
MTGDARHEAAHQDREVLLHHREDGPVLREVLAPRDRLPRLKGEAMSENVFEIDAQRYEAEVVKSSLPVVLDFYSTECPPCEALAPRFAAVADRFAGKARFMKVMRQTNRELAVELGVMSSPTVLFLKAGVEVGPRMCGQIRATDLEAGVEALLR